MHLHFYKCKKILLHILEIPHAYILQVLSEGEKQNSCPFIHKLTSSTSCHSFTLLNQTNHSVSVFLLSHHMAHSGFYGSVGSQN